MQLFREVTTLDQKKTQSLNDNTKGYENALFKMIEALYLEFGQVNKYVNDLHKCYFPDGKPGIARDIKDIKELLPEQNITSKDLYSLWEQLNKLANLEETLKAKQEELDSYREKTEHLTSDLYNLWEQLNKLANLEETLKAKQEELDSYRDKTEHLTSLLSFRDYENSNLRDELKSKNADNYKLKQWIEKLNERVSRLFRSKEWRVGYFFGELMRKLLRRPSNKKLEDKICEIFLDYDSWQKVRDNQIKE